MKPIVDLLTQTRKSLTLRSLFMTGFPHDPEFFAAGVALARQWTRQGLKVAVVDLDYRHPTLQRPRPDPNEGYVDALEYGCSFQRVAWELVADTLWLVGPGSHPPDETRFAEHSDWARVMRIFSARVDLTLYLAPFLDRKGFTGSLSKRMDGVLLAASVQRSGRAALRDAFLELWGSDAPMIGCLGLAVPYGSAPRGEVELGPVSSPSTPSDWSFPSPEPQSRIPTPDRRVAPMAAQPEPKPVALPAAPPPEPSQQERRSTPRPPNPVRPQPDIPSPSLVSRLSEEVRTGRPTRTPSPSRRGLLFVGLLLVLLAGVGAYLTVQAMRRPGSRAAVPAETLPAGTEAVLPAPGDSPATGSGDTETTDEPTTEAPAGDAELPASPQAPPTPSPGSVASTVARTPASGLKFQVHVASFRSESKVRDLVKSLRDRGLDSWYAAAADQPGWYRVFVGHYATHGEAARKAAWLLDHGWVDRARAYPDNER